jgi:hypothetical protein
MISKESPAEKYDPIDLSLLSKTSREMIANFALEGIYPTKETLHYLVLLDTGQITEEEFFNSCMAHIQKKD